VPLTSVGHEPTLMTGYPQGFGFWMTADGGDPAGAVWIWVTAECLRQIDSSKTHDAAAGFETVDKFREVIENAASVKFDREGVNPADGLHEGMPILFVLSVDIPTV
jgi:hypothetical protein